MSVAAIIETRVTEALQPAYLRVENESHLHGGPATESHFKLVVVADEFIDMQRVKRHQRLYALLADEMANGIHALALHLYSPDEWSQLQQQAPASPDCRGGSRN